MREGGVSMFVGTILGDISKGQGWVLIKVQCVTSKCIKTKPICGIGYQKF